MTERITFPQNNVISQRSLAEKVKSISNYVVLVKVNMPLEEASSETPAASGNHSDKACASELYITALEGIKEKDFHQALQDISESVHLYPTLQGHRLRFNIAWNIANRDALEESAKYCVEHGDEDARIKYAIALQLQAKHEEAIEQASILIKANAKDLMALSVRASSYSALERWDEMIADNLQIIRHEGIVQYNGYATAYNNLAWGYLNKGHLDAAQEPIQKALELNHTLDYIWDTAGELAYRLGNYEACIRSMTNAIAIASIKGDKTVGNSYLYRGLARKALGDLAGAYTDLERANELGEEQAAAALATIDVSTIDFSTSARPSIRIKNPKIRRQKSRNIDFGEVELTHDYTALYLSFTHDDFPADNWYNTDPNAYLRDKKTGKKYICLATDNCAFAPNRTDIKYKETKEFILYFEAIPQGTYVIDFIENSSSDWQIYGIELKE